MGPDSRGPGSLEGDEMREIKYRFRYSDGSNTITEIFTMVEIMNGAPFEVISDNPLLKKYKMVGYDEFTDLHDKNGKEIYEGDMLLYKYDGKKEYLKTVEYVSGCFGYYQRCDYFRTLSDINLTEFELIGTIHDKEGDK